MKQQIQQPTIIILPKQNFAHVTLSTFKTFKQKHDALNTLHSDMDKQKMNITINTRKR